MQANPAGLLRRVLRAILYYLKKQLRPKRQLQHLL